MKKLLLLLLCVLPFIGYAQNDVATNFVSSPDPSYKGLKPKAKTYLDQVFANAIESDDGRLIAKIDVKQKCKFNDIVTYINEQNAYTTITIMGNNATMTGIRLDPHDPKAIVTTVLFLKKGDYKKYALTHLAKYAAPLSKVSINGTNANAYIYTFDYLTQLLTQNNVVWNGSLSNGKISGDGQGYYYNNGTIIYFDGSFKDGYPSDCRFYQYTIKEDEIFQRSKVREEGIIVGDFREGLAVFTKPRELYGFINQNGEIVIEQQYTKVVEPFHDGKAVVWDDKRHGNVIINTNGDFVELDEKYIYENVINGTSSYSQLSSTGKGMVFGFDFGGIMIDNFKWSGDIVNGMINGNGSGFAKNGKDYYFVSGTFVNGFPNGTVVFKKLYLSNDFFDLNNVKPIEHKIVFDDLSEGMAFFEYSGKYYSLVDEQGKVIALNMYREVLKPFENGYAEVVKDDKEIIIDKNGEFVDYTAYQKEHDEAERKAEEAKRIEEEKRRIAEEKAAEQARIAAQNQARIEELNKEWDDLVKKCTEKCMEEWKRTSLVGREVAWEEKITYDISNGNQGLILNLLSSALGQNSVSYTVRYTAILESYIGTTACKVIISRTDIQDPSWASANYLKYRKAAQNDISKNLGQTRVKQLNEIYEQTPVTQEEIESFGQKFLQSPEGKKINKRIEEIKAELKKLKGE